MTKKKDARAPSKQTFFFFFSKEAKKRKGVLVCPPMKKRERDDTVHNAICDACNENIVGVRRKCRVCTDFDLCEECFDVLGDEHGDGFEGHSLYEVRLGELVSEAQRHLFGEVDETLQHLEAKVSGGIDGAREYLDRLEAQTGRRFKLLRGAVPGEFVAVEEE